MSSQFYETEERAANDATDTIERVEKLHSVRVCEYSHYRPVETGERPYSSTEWHYVTTIDDNDSASYGDFNPVDSDAEITRSHYLMPDYLSGGDYANSSMLEVPVASRRTRANPASVSSTEMRNGW